MAKVKKTSRVTKTKRHSLMVIYIFIFFTFFLLFNSLKKSLFFTKRERVNIIMYGANSRYYSLGIFDKTHYFISFSADEKAQVPGGYGYYRFGGLGKLTDLEKKPEIIRKTFSSVTSSFIDYYFLPPKTDGIFYGAEKAGITIPNMYELFTYRSNADIFDRLYLFSYLIGKRKNEFITLSVQSKEVDNESHLLKDEFAKLYQGYLYQKTYRKEQKTVQLLYTKSYKTALNVSSIIEGEGIRIVDISIAQNNPTQCIVYENKNVFSETALSLGHYFKCQVLAGKTEVSDILMMLGEKEKEWEVE